VIYVTYFCALNHKIRIMKHKSEIVNVYKIGANGEKINSVMSRMSYEMNRGVWQEERQLTEEERKPIKVETIKESLKAQGFDVPEPTKTAAEIQLEMAEKLAGVTEAEPEKIDLLEEVTEAPKPVATKPTAKKPAPKRKPTPKK